MAQSTRLRCGDLVQVMTGRSKGKSGKILRIDRSKERVVVEQVNLVKKHLKPTQDKPHGGVQDVEASIHWSNVQILCPKTNTPDRIRVTRDKDGKRQRMTVKSGQKIGS